MRDVLTTGQVAKICNVTIRTVIKWFENGKLDGYKIPASKDRRIPKDALRQFLREHRIPHDTSLFDARPRLLVADDDKSLVMSLKEAFSRSGALDVMVATSGYQAGYMTARHRPDILLIDFNLGDITAPEVLATLHRDDIVPGPRIIIMSGVLDPEQVGQLRVQGHHVITKPFDVNALDAEIRTMVKA